MKKTLILGGLAVLALCASVAVPAQAHEGETHNVPPRRSGGYTHPYDVDSRYRSPWDRNWSGRSNANRRDREHDKHHRRLEREHRRAHRRGFEDREDHRDWHRKAGEHHDADHHRIYDRHAPNRKRYYGDERDYTRDNYRNNDRGYYRSR